MNAQLQTISRLNSKVLLFITDLYCFSEWGGGVGVVRRCILIYAEDCLIFVWRCNLGSYRSDK